MKSMKRFTRTESANVCPNPQHIAPQIPGGKSEPSLMLASPELGPIYRLAPELVQAIFQQTHQPLVEAGFCYVEEDKHTIRPLTLAIKLSHVCNLWRNIALATPSLWTSIDRFHDDYDFATLSQNHPIRLILQAYPQPALPFPAWLQKCSGRICSIMAECPVDIIHKLLQHVGRFFPNLESLELRAVDDEYGGLEELDAPKLKRLILDRVLLSSFSTISNLTHLTLHGLIPQHACPSGRDIIDLLRRCPQLEALCLYELDLSITSADDVSIGVPKIVLTALETIRMHGLSMATAGYICSRIQVPNCAPLFTKCDAAPSGDDGFWMEVDLHRGGHIALGVSSASPYYSVSTFPYDLLQVRPGFLRKGVDFAASAFDLSTVASLKLMVPPTFSANDKPAVADWHTLFSRMPSLSSMAISMPRAWIETFICALCDGEDALVCPALSGLSIVDVNYTGNCELVTVVHSHLQIRARIWGTMLNIVRIHRGYNHNLNWGDVTRIYDPNYAVDNAASAPPLLVAMSHI